MTGDPEEKQGSALVSPGAVSPEIVAEQRRSREGVLSGILWASAAAFGFTTPWLLAQEPIPDFAKLVFAGGLLVVGVAALARRAPFSVRVGALLAALYAASTASILVRGFAPNAFLGYALLIVSATLAIGRRAGLVGLGAAASTLVGVSLLHRFGLFERTPDWALYVDSGTFPAVVRVPVIFTLVMLTIVIGVSYVVGRSEEATLARARALEALRREEREMARIQADLVRREAAYRRAEELEVLGRLAGSMAHDFNNALLVMAASADELERQPDLTPASREAVELIRLACEQAGAATRGLHAFGPRGPREVRPLALAEVTQRTSEMLKRVLPRNIEVVTELEQGLSIVSDEGLIQRVIANLALNARDAMREGGRLALRVRRAVRREAGPPEGSTGEWAVLEVEDNGSGMSDEVKARLFEPFFTTKGGAGTGLGLSTVREAVEAQGGTVDVDSAPRRGTKVTVRWPMAPASERPEQHGARGSHAERGDGVTVLFVDDDAAVRAAVRRGLTHLGFMVLDAPDPAEGLLLLRRHRQTIHVLCCNGSGSAASLRQLVEGYRNAYAEGRILLCSDYPADHEPGVVAHGSIEKPFSPEVLGERIRAVLGGSKPTTTSARSTSGRHTSA